MSRKNDPARSITSRWEWVAAALSAGIVAGTLIVLGMAAVETAQPPDIDARADTVISLAHGYLARVTVSNHGTETAADVVVEAELSGAGPATERSTVTLDYIPGRAERTVGFFFTSDPGTGELRIRAHGYTQP